MIVWQIQGIMIMRSQQLGLACVCLLAFWGCGDEDDPPQLSASHPGWQRADCAACHSLDSVHGGSRTWDMCFGCHGDNGQPNRPAGHLEAGCTTCHNPGGSAPWNDSTHADYASWEATGCLGCHDPS